MDIQPIVCLQRTTPPSPATANAQPQLEKSTCVAVGSRDLPARGLCMTCPAEQPHSRCGCDATANAQPILGVSVIRRHPPPLPPTSRSAQRHSKVFSHAALSPSASPCRGVGGPVFDAAGRRPPHPQPPPPSCFHASGTCQFFDRRSSDLKKFSARRVKFSVLVALT